MKYLDFEGLADGKSIRTVISNIMPRKLVSAAIRLLKLAGPTLGWKD